MVEEEGVAVARGTMEEREARGECVVRGLTMRWVGVWDVLGNLIRRVV